MTIATLWNDRKPTTFLMSCGTSVFKIIQTSKGKRKLVGYFENWEATLKALDTPQVFLTLDKELKWCQHSVPTLKKQHKPKAKNTSNKKSGNTGQISNSNKPKKKEERRIRSSRPSMLKMITKYQSDEEDTNDNEFTFNAFNNSDTEELEETSVIDECNDTFEKTNNSDNINSEQWTKIIEDWIKMVNAEINIDNTEVIGEETYEFEVGGQSIYPADNLLAKWRL
ncbi:hypothetical protein RhiirA4_472482 [Rhizophagus irregularis]|uniref:Uncharacterized protein n=1 Tax=Rhizophagus irregularis TaxID=588596 RepID=A0A2I1H531_9GLOM|nr:hypothetical protein RhiirA4_472482 [Rhizophagus irregularis]